MLHGALYAVAGLCFALAQYLCCRGKIGGGKLYQKASEEEQADSEEESGELAASGESRESPTANLPTPTK